jgi:hypothetical protein
MATLELSRPFNWCDYRCERCPLHHECPSSGAAIRSIEEVLGDGLAAAEAAYEAGEGPQISDEPPPAPSDEAGLDVPHTWLTAWNAVVERDPRALLVIGKIARVYGELAYGDDDLRASDTIPNLILIQHLLAAVRDDAERLRATRRDAVERFDAIDHVLRDQLEPLFDLITDDDRAVVDALAAARRAPSPFATT